MRRHITAIAVLLVLAASTTVFGDGGHNLWRTIKPAAPDKFLVYESTIVPWLQHEFSRAVDIHPTGIVKRGLVRSDLLRYENINGQNRYNVHIEYRVFIRDASGVEISGLKGQEIVFLVSDGAIKDYFPFNEYWIEGVVLQEGDFY